VGEREARELSLVQAWRLNHVEMLEVDIQSGSVVERVDAVSGASGHEHRLADPPPAMPHADAERGAGSNAGRHNGVA
jgi:hypothetical protein